jgi:hypothetical protein
VRSDSSRSARKEDRGSKMATEGHRQEEKQGRKLAGMDRELADIRAEIERLELLMLRQDKRVVEVCEPETGKGLDDDDDDDWDELGSSEDLKDCQEGKRRNFGFPREQQIEIS